MPAPTLSTRDLLPADLDADVLVLGVRVTPDGPTLVGLDALAEGEFSTERLRAIGVTGAGDSTARLAAPESITARSLLLVGLGAGEPTADVLRSAAGSAARAAGDAASLALGLPTDSAEAVQAVLEGAALGAYRYTDYRTTEPNTTLQHVALATSVTAAEDAARRARITSEAVMIVRDLVNTPCTTKSVPGIVRRSGTNRSRGRPRSGY